MKCNGTKILVSFSLSPAMEATDTVAITVSCPLVKRMFGANNEECGAVFQ